MFPRKWEPPKEKPEPEKHYFEIEVDPAQRIALLDLIRWRLRQTSTTAALSAFLKRLETEVLCARKMDMPLVRERLPWSLARERGCSEVELFEDLARMKDPQ